MEFLAFSINLLSLLRVFTHHFLLSQREIIFYSLEQQLYPYYILKKISRQIFECIKQQSINFTGKKNTVNLYLLYAD